MEDIGLSPQRQFTDLKDMTIPALFKLYPWEFMFEEEFGPYIPEQQNFVCRTIVEIHSFK